MDGPRQDEWETTFSRCSPHLGRWLPERVVFYDIDLCVFAFCDASSLLTYHPRARRCFFIYSILIHSLLYAMPR